MCFIVGCAEKTEEKALFKEGDVLKFKISGETCQVINCDYYSKYPYRIRCSSKELIPSLFWVREFEIEKINEDNSR